MEYLTVTDLNPNLFVTGPLNGAIMDCHAQWTLRQALAVLPPLSLENGPFIAGGILLRAILGLNEVSDVDVFCLTTDQFNDTARFLTYAGAKVPEYRSGDPEAPSMGGDPSLVNFYLPAGNEEIKIQLINVQERAVPNTSPREVLMGFDITAAMLGTDGTNLTMHVSTADSIFRKALILNQSEQRRRLLAYQPRLNDNEARLRKYAALLAGGTSGS